MIWCPVCCGAPSRYNVKMCGAHCHVGGVCLSAMVNEMFVCYRSAVYELTLTVSQRKFRMMLAIFEDQPKNSRVFETG